VVGGTDTTGTVTISVPAPSAGISVALSKQSSDTGAPFVTLPPSVTVPAGKTSVTFTIHTAAVSRQVGCTLIATFSGSGQVQTAFLTIMPAQ